MLGKLLKYDLKWVYKVVLVFYILSLIFSGVGRILSEIENSVLFNVVAQVFIGIAISMMVSSLINCIMRLWARFVKNIYKDESYLTHTLPVEKKKIYVSKVISAFITVFTTIVFILFCLFICYYSQANMENLKALLELAATVYNTTVVNLLLLVAFVFFLEVMFVVLIGYLGIILGHKSNKNKMVRTLIISFALYFLFQIVSLGIAYVYGLIDPNVMNIINTTDIVNVDAIKSIMYVGSVLYFVYIIILYILGKVQLAKGVNVD